ncbi:MAG TPA: FHA domain-containing protein [Planktothrix sp.]|jgi:hypothetical protein
MATYLIDQETSEQYAVTEPTCTVGSGANNNIVLNYDHVQSVHVNIDFRGDACYATLAPGASKMRKFLFFFDIPTAKYNEIPLDGSPRKLTTGDRLLIGSRLLEFHLI